MPARIDCRARSYDGAADIYERGRPDYRPEPVAHVVRTLGIGPGSTVLDLAAGTGKFTRQLLPTGAQVIAVEPVAGMRAQLSVAIPGIHALEGTAEAIPLPAATVDAVTVAQAFHWFRGPEALTEISRVLKHGGGLALVWNVSDDSEPVLRKLAELVDRHSGDAPQYQTGKWREAFALPNGFTPLAQATFPIRQEVTVEQVVDRIRSTSFIAGLPENERANLLEDVRSLMREHMAGPGAGRIVLPSATEVYTCSKR